MRIALISDIHGNLSALDTVLAEIERQGVDQIICLGDVATLGPHPRAVVERLQHLGCACIMGNHDLFLLRPELALEYTSKPWIVESIQWAHTQMSATHLAYLQAFVPTLSLPLDAHTNMLCFHGSPRSSMEGLFVQTTDQELSDICQGHHAQVWAGGHTHEPLIREWASQTLLIVGSVGHAFARRPDPTQLVRLSPWAHYALLSVVNGAVHITACRVPLDVERLRASAEGSTWPGRTEWQTSWNER